MLLSLIKIVIIAALSICFVSAAVITINTDCSTDCATINNENSDDDNNNSSSINLNYNADTNITDRVDYVDEMSITDISSSSEPLIKRFRINFKTVGTNTCLLVEDTSSMTSQEVYGPDEETCKQYFKDTEFVLAGELTNPLEIKREHTVGSQRAVYLTFTAENRFSQEVTQVSYIINENKKKPKSLALGNVAVEDCNNTSTVSASKTVIPLQQPAQQQIVTQEKTQNSGVSQREAYITITRTPIYGRLNIPFRDQLIPNTFPKFPQTSAQFIPQTTTTIVQQNPSFDSQFAQQLHEPFPDFPQTSQQFIPQTVVEEQQSPAYKARGDAQQRQTSQTGSQFQPVITQSIEQNPTSSYGTQTSQQRYTTRYVIQTRRQIFPPIVKHVQIQRTYPFFGVEQQPINLGQQYSSDYQQKQSNFPQIVNKVPQQQSIPINIGQHYAQTEDQNEPAVPFFSQNIQQYPTVQHYSSRTRQYSSPITVQTSQYSLPSSSFFQYPFAGQQQQYSLPPQTQGSSNFKRCCITVTV